MGDRKIFSSGFGLVLAGLVFAAGFVVFTQVIFLQNREEALAAGTTSSISSVLTISNSSPIVSSVIVNGGSSSTLIANATTAINVTANIADYNGCADITGGTSTILLYRSSITSSTCMTTKNNLNCYLATAFTATSSCLSNTNINTTTTFGVYYFAQATDASSSFPSDNWLATVIASDSSHATGSNDSSGVELLTLTAISASTSSISYGTVNPSSTTGWVNQIMSISDVGNSSSTLQVSGIAMTNGSNSLATSSQHYASSTFYFGVSGGGDVLTNTATTISGVTIRPRVSLVNDVGSWADTSALPAGFTDAATTVYGNYAYFLGGTEYTAIADTSTVYYAQVNTDGTLGSWATNATSMPAARLQHSAVAYNGYLYVLGGQGTSSVIYAPIAANGTIGTWATGTSLATTTWYFPAAAYNGYLYVFGGSVPPNNTTSSVIYAQINTNGSIGSWNYTTALPVKLTYHAGVIRNGYVYLIGGDNEVPGTNGTSSVSYAKMNSDGTVGQWSYTTALPAIRFNETAVANGDYIYVVGGFTDTVGSVTSSVLYAPINSDATVGSWVNTTALSAKTVLHTSFAKNGYLYELTGKNTNGGVGTSTVRYSTVSNGLSQADTFWGVGLTDFVPPGTYSGVNTFVAVFSP